MTSEVFCLPKWFKWQEMTSLSAAYQLHPRNSSVLTIVSPHPSLFPLQCSTLSWHKGVTSTVSEWKPCTSRHFIGLSCCTHRLGNHSCGDCHPQMLPVPASAHTLHPESPVSCCWVNRGWWTCVKLWSTAHDSLPHAHRVLMNVGKSHAAAYQREGGDGARVNKSINVHIRAKQFYPPSTPFT